LEEIHGAMVRPGRSQPVRQGRIMNAFAPGLRDAKIEFRLTVRRPSGGGSVLSMQDFIRWNVSRCRGTACGPGQGEAAVRREQLSFEPLYEAGPGCSPTATPSIAGVLTRMDTHCHSAASSGPALKALGWIGCPECYSPPEKVYEQAMAR